MSQVADFDILKEIPGYKAILKSVLKTQIQLLIEQLSDQTGEESIILTASINEGTLSHLGSNMGKGFFEGRDEIKSQFLGYCLKNYQRKDGSQGRTAYQDDTSPDGFQQGPPKRQKVHPVSVTRVEEDYGSSSFIPDPGSQDTFTPSLDRKKALTGRAPNQPSAQNMKRPSSSSGHSSPVIPSTQLGGNGVKIEANSDNQDSDKTVDSPHEPISVHPFEPAVLPSSVHLSHTQTEQSYTAITDNGAEPKDDSNLSAMGQSGDSSEHSNVKIEPVTENELELEITGVEMAGGPTGFQGDWGQDISGGMGYDQSDSRDSSFDQSGNQYNASEDMYFKSFGEIDGVRFTYFTCTACGRVFKAKANLERHYVIHTGQKDFACNLCGKAFRRKDTLRNHLRFHHSAARNHPCLFCGKAFKKKDTLKHHMFVKHPDL